MLGASFLRTMGKANKAKGKGKRKAQKVKHAGGAGHSAGGLDARLTAKELVEKAEECSEKCEFDAAVKYYER